MLPKAKCMPEIAHLHTQHTATIEPLSSYFRITVHAVRGCTHMDRLQQLAKLNFQSKY